MTLFSNKWAKPRRENVSNRILEGIKPNVPLKRRIKEAQQKLQLQISRLHSTASKMEQRDQLIFKRIINALQNYDVECAKISSGELSQIRKMIKMI
jgi:division protein CdvB (Snf7/Vps24/ESCRT-III family)